MLCKTGTTTLSLWELKGTCSLVLHCSPTLHPSSRCLTFHELHPPTFLILFLPSFRDDVRLREKMLSAPNDLLCSIFTTNSSSESGLTLNLGDIWAASLYCWLVFAMEKELKLNTTLMNTVGKEQYHIHFKVKRQCLGKLFVVLL